MGEHAGVPTDMLASGNHVVTIIVPHVSHARSTHTPSHAAVALISLDTSLHLPHAIK